MKVIERSTCRVSQGKLWDVLDLGNMPVSCFPLPQDPDPERHPLQLALCKESGLVQLRHSVDADELYRHYWYVSGINASMQCALKSIVDQALRRKKVTRGDVVLDIACNDGTLLSFYPEYLVRVGIDPAKNIKPKACDVHANTYFSEGVYKGAMRDKKADIVTSIAVFYDLEDPLQFSRDVREILSEEGLWIIELSYLPAMLKNYSFDTICAEHLEYYSLRSIEYILDKSGLEVEDVECNGVNGGSFRLYIRHAGKGRETAAVREMRAQEEREGLCDVETYRRFARQIEQNKLEALSFLRGKKVIGYGASTKGNTILAYCGIGPELLPFIADRNPLKWGRQTVTRIPIISEEEARRLHPDYFLAFPHHFMEEFLKREEAFIKKGGQFISLIPRLRVFP